MTKEQAIKKYQLKQDDPFLYGYKDFVAFELWQNLKRYTDKEVFFTLDNQMSAELGDGSEFVLTVQTFYADGRTAQRVYDIAA